MKFSALQVILLSSISLVASLSPTYVHSGTGIHPGDPEPPAPIDEKEVFIELGDKVPEIDKIKVAPASVAEGSGWWSSWFGEPKKTYAASTSAAEGSGWWGSVFGESKSADTVPATGSDTDIIEVSGDSIWDGGFFGSLTSGIGELGSLGVSGLGSLADVGISGLGLLGSAGYTTLEYTGAGLAELGAFATHPQTIETVGGIASTTGTALMVGTGIAATVAGGIGYGLLNKAFEGLSSYYDYYDYYGHGYNLNHDDYGYDNDHNNDEYHGENIDEYHDDHGY